MVPEIFCQSAPCFSATTRYIANSIDAGELIVIDVVMSAREIPSNSVSMSASDATLTPHFPTSPSDSAWSGSRPISVGRSNATLRPGAAVRQQFLVAEVGLLRRPVAGELPHRPQLAAVAGRVDAAGVGEFAGLVQVARVVEPGEVRRAVDAADRPAGHRRKALGNHAVIIASRAGPRAPPRRIRPAVGGPRRPAARSPTRPRSRRRAGRAFRQNPAPCAARGAYPPGAG